MNIILRLDNKEIKVNNYECFKNKALIVMPSDQQLSFAEILILLENNDLSELTFYAYEGSENVFEDEPHPIQLHGSLVGYSELISYNNNIESKLYTFNLKKPNVELEQITNMEMALVDLYESIEGNKL